MENVVAARRLRKSVLNSVGEVDLDLYDVNRVKTHKEKYSQVKKEEVILENFKTKVIFKLFCCSLVLFSVIITKMFFLEDVKTNPTIVRLYSHYNTHFSKECILGKFEYRTEKLNSVIGNIVPQDIKTFLVNKYNGKVKPYITSFSIKASFERLINLEPKKEVTIESKTTPDVIVEANYLNAQAKEEILAGVGGAGPIEDLVEKVSSISTMDLDVEEIRSKNISIIHPVSGTVSSRYGAREEIFEGVNPYHTGIDIANKKGTLIYSATKGIVTKIEFNNKFYGNFVEVTEKDVTFKYAHLSTISVNQGTIINQKDKIGTMGSTGMSTGPHLHFEIKVNGRAVNPEDLLKF